MLVILKRTDTLASKYGKVLPLLLCGNAINISYWKRFICSSKEVYLIHMYVYRFQNVFLRCPTSRLHCFLSSHWPSFRFLSFMAFLIPSIQYFFGLPHVLFCFGIHFNAILGNLPSAIL